MLIYPLVNFVTNSKLWSGHLTKVISINILQKQPKSFDKNLNIEVSSFEQVLKDGRETKIWLIRALIHFHSFKNKKGVLHNEFSSEKQLMNLELLKRH